MALDAKVAELLANLPPEAELSQYTPQEARKRLLSTTPVSELRGDDRDLQVTDLDLRVAHGTVPVRIYRPSATETAPVVMHFHGGGFVTGSIDVYDGNARDLARLSGCAVVAVGYRLAPEHPFPAGFDGWVR